MSLHILAEYAIGRSFHFLTPVLFVPISYVGNKEHQGNHRKYLLSQEERNYHVLLFATILQLPLKKKKVLYPEF
jgi:hypothetical protein